MATLASCDTVRLVVYPLRPPCVSMRMFAIGFIRHGLHAAITSNALHIVSSADYLSLWCLCKMAAGGPGLTGTDVLCLCSITEMNEIVQAANTSPICLWHTFMSGSSRSPALTEQCPWDFTGQAPCLHLLCCSALLLEVGSASVINFWPVCKPLVALHVLCKIASFQFCMFCSMIPLATLSCCCCCCWGQVSCWPGLAVTTIVTAQAKLSVPVAWMHTSLPVVPSLAGCRSRLASFNQHSSHADNTQSPAWTEIGPHTCLASSCLLHDISLQGQRPGAAGRHSGAVATHVCFGSTTV